MFSVMTRDGWLGIDIEPFSEERDISGFVYHRVRLSKDLIPVPDDGTLHRNGIPFDRCGLMLPKGVPGDAEMPLCCFVSFNWEWYDGRSWSENFGLEWK